MTDPVNPAWDGRPPKEHEQAPSHLLRDMQSGRTWTGAFDDGWWTFLGHQGVTRPEAVADDGFEYIAPLYPTPAAPREVAAGADAGEVERLVEELRRLHEKASPAPWEMDTLENADGEYGGGPDGGRGYDACQMLAPNHRGEPTSIFDSLNASQGEIHEEHDGDDGKHAWDEIARRNFALIAVMRNALPTLLRALAAPSSTPVQGEAMLGLLRSVWWMGHSAAADFYRAPSDHSVRMMRDPGDYLLKVAADRGIVPAITTPAPASEAVREVWTDERITGLLAQVSKTRSWIQGFTYGDKHVIRDLRRPPGEQAIYEEEADPALGLRARFYHQCEVEVFRAALRALPPQHARAAGEEVDRLRAENATLKAGVCRADIACDRLADALQAARAHCVLWQGEPRADGDAIHNAVMAEIDAALTPPSEVATTGGEGR